jgi:hypothetical protein
MHMMVRGTRVAERLDGAGQGDPIRSSSAQRPVRATDSDDLSSIDPGFRRR